MTTDTKLNQLIINKLTQEQYDEAKAAGTLSDTELYITDSDDEALTNNKISNCITEIPQDIKLELNNGTLTLKAGSKVYIPNGAGVFDEVVNDSDLVYNFGTPADGQYLIFNSQYFYSLSNCVSGETDSKAGQDYHSWFDITNNLVKQYWADRSTPAITDSLPVAIITISNGVITSIDQVFNGFGYIGSTIFALPGVKGLIPNGRNADGSLKNVEFTISQVQTFSITSEWGTGVEGWWLNGTNMNIHRSIIATYFQDSKPSTSYKDAYWFSPKENILRGTTNTGATWIQKQGSYCFNTSFTSGKITSLTPKTVFHALDYNDKSTISGWSMPSNRYIDLTLGASGSTYTAPANGYFQIWKIAGIDKAFFNFVNKTNNMAVNSNTTDTVYSSRMILPVRKGDVIECTYNSTGSTNIFRFIYAEGE